VVRFVDLCSDLLFDSRYVANPLLIPGDCVDLSFDSDICGSIRRSTF